MVREALKWLAALAWAAAGLVMVDAFWPLERDEAVWRVIAPPARVTPREVVRHLLRWVGRGAARMAPRPLVRWVERLSDRIPGSLGREGWLGAAVGAGLAGAVWLLPAAGLSAAHPAANALRSVGRLVAGFVLGASGGLAWLHFRASGRCNRIAQDLPGFVDLLLLGLEGGMGLTAAMTEAARRLEGPLGEEMAEVERQAALGLSRGEAMKAMADRLDLSELTTLVSLLHQAEALGSGVTRAVSAIAQRLRTSRVLAAERRVGEAPVKMLFPLVFCLFPSVLVLLVGPLLIGRESVLGW